MPRINSASKWFQYWAGAVLAFYTVFYINRLGLAIRIMGQEMATTIYNIGDIILQVGALVIALVAVAVFVYTPISYFRNRSKPDKPTAELEAVSALSKEIRGLRQDLKRKGKVG